jgi:hypothetical protein
VSVEDSDPREALRLCLDEFNTAFRKRRRAVSNVRRWGPQLDQRISALTASKMRSYNESGLPPDACEVTSLILMSREHRVLQRIVDSQKKAETGMGKAVTKVRLHCIRLARDSSEAWADLAFLDRVSLAPIARADEFVAFVQRLIARAEVPGKTVVPQPGLGLARAPRLQLSKWTDLTICFVSDERVEVLVVGKPAETRNYAEMGFADRRSKKATKPIRAWTVLKSLTERQGKIPKAAGSSGWPKIEKRVEEIRERLKQLYECDDDPIPFVPGEGYQANFQVTKSPSYNY